MLNMCNGRCRLPPSRSSRTGALCDPSCSCDQRFIHPQARSEASSAKVKPCLFTHVDIVRPSWSSVVVRYGPSQAFAAGWDASMAMCTVCRLPPPSESKEVHLSSKDIASFFAIGLRSQLREGESSGGEDRIFFVQQPYCQSNGQSTSPLTSSS